MAQFPFMFSTVPHISFTVKKSPSPPPPPSPSAPASPPPPSSSSSSFRFGYGLLSNHYLSLPPFCLHRGGRERSAPVSTVSSSPPSPSSKERFNKCFSIKHSPRALNTPSRASTHLALPSAVLPRGSVMEEVLPSVVMELEDDRKVIEHADVHMEDSPSAGLNTDNNATNSGIPGTQGDIHLKSETDKATEDAGEIESDVLEPSVIDSVRSISDGEIQPAFIDTESKSEVSKEIDISEPSVFDSSMPIIHDEDIVLDDVVENAVSDTEKSSRVSNGGIEGAVSNMAKNSSVSNEEFEQYFFKLSVLYGTDMENSFKDYVRTLKKSDSMELEPYRSIPIKKEGLVIAILRRSRFFVTRKIKNSAMLGRRMLRRDKHKTKKKVIVRTNIVHEAGNDKLWSKPILKGKRCRELPIEEYP